jgi:hypothetical protein
MAENITKIIFRQGSDTQRRTANNGGGVVFNSAEPAFCFDTRRMYGGDGRSGGGVPVGMRNLGAVNKLFGTFSNTGFTQEAYNVMTLSGAAVGDIIYDRDTRILYSLTGASSFPPLTSNFVKYDFTVLINPLQLEFNTLGQVQIKNEGVGYSQIDSSVAGSGLTKPLVNGPINISVNGVQNDMIQQQPGFTVLGNPGINLDGVEAITVYENSFIGRTNTNQLTSFPFSYISSSTVNSNNGIQKVVGSSTVLQLSTDVFFVTPTKVDIKKATTVHNTLSTVNGITTTGTVTINNSTAIDASDNSITCGTITSRTILAQKGVTKFSVTCGTLDCTSITTNNGNLTMGTGDIGCDAISCNSITTNNGNITMGTGDISCDVVSCNSVNTNNGNINAGTGTISCQTLQATGDIIAFFTSDSRLKNNIKKIESPLQKISGINGYTFTWNASDTITKRTGDDVGLMAQEVKNVIPQAVIVRENGFYGLDYIKVIPLLVESIKELKQKVEHLENIIQSNS